MHSERIIPVERIILHYSLCFYTNNSIKNWPEDFMSISTLSTDSIRGRTFFGHNKKKSFETYLRWWRPIGLTKLWTERPLRWWRPTLLRSLLQNKKLHHIRNQFYFQKKMWIMGPDNLNIDTF